MIRISAAASFALFAITIIVAPHANATTDASRVRMLDAQIADAKQAATAAQKAAETICYNAGYTAAGILTETGITTRSRQPPG